MSLSYAIWINHTRREYVVFHGNDTPFLHVFQMARGRWHFARDNIVTRVRHSLDDFAVIDDDAAAVPDNFVCVDNFWPNVPLLKTIPPDEMTMYLSRLRETYECAPAVTSATYFCINRDNTHRLTAVQLSYVDTLKQRTAFEDAPAVSFDEIMCLMQPYVQQQIQQLQELQQFHQTQQLHIHAHMLQFQQLQTQ